MKKLPFLSTIAILSFMGLSLADGDVSEYRGGNMQTTDNEKPAQNEQHDGDKHKRYYPEHRRHDEQTMECTDEEQTEDNNECRNKQTKHEEENCTDGICTYDLPEF